MKISINGIAKDVTSTSLEAVLHELVMVMRAWQPRSWQFCSGGQRASCQIEAVTAGIVTRGRR